MTKIGCPSGGRSTNAGGSCMRRMRASASAGAHRVLEWRRRLEAPPFDGPRDSFSGPGPARSSAPICGPDAAARGRHLAAPSAWRPPYACSKEVPPWVTRRQSDHQSPRSQSRRSPSGRSGSSSTGRAHPRNRACAVRRRDSGSTAQTRRIGARSTIRWCRTLPNAEERTDHDAEGVRFVGAPRDSRPGQTDVQAT